MEQMKEQADKIELIRHKIEDADAIVIGAGAGLSTAAGFTYSGDRFEKYFSDFGRACGFSDMYSGGFYDYATLEEYWAYWSRYIYINRYQDVENGTYRNLYALVKDKDYFVLTTNVDHQFQKAGFAKERLFYTQGDYGLFQCGRPCHAKTYDNEKTVRDMVLAQGYAIAEDGALYLPEGVMPKMSVPAELVPRCPKCGRPMSMNLRADNTFVEDAGWKAASASYVRFMEDHIRKKIVFLELGVGYNTPGIIKYNFWQYAANWQNAFYICINQGQAYLPEDIEDKGLAINADIMQILEGLL